MIANLAAPRKQKVWLLPTICHLRFRTFFHHSFIVAFHNGKNSFFFYAMPAIVTPGVCCEPLIKYSWEVFVQWHFFTFRFFFQRKSRKEYLVSPHLKTWSKFIVSLYHHHIFDELDKYFDFEIFFLSMSPALRQIYI